ncbi:hypothetical protein K435DRAFT_801702 [Dendrothele bispora CBS 962.96]|uniref:Uncharacterized protein n=1 Tax=Dendrothele bispora (strain CBS 962.96) TaxID=1314807 RepID=A0A4S8LNK4_DENBC|nr:hypothetical protein K435DRAFT_801702 [Dendrothele bispora CBS 962.96]
MNVPTSKSPIQVLQELFPNLQSFAQFAAVVESPDRIAALLETFPSSQDLDRALFLTKKGWFTSSRSAVNIILESLQSCRTSPTQRQTQESTTANEAFADDPLSISEGDGDEAFSQLATLLPQFDNSSRTPTFMSHTLKPHYISLEGSKTYVDHMIMLHYSDGDFKGSPIVIHEEKIYGAMEDWRDWMYLQDDGYYVLNSRFPNLRKMIPQIRKYVFQHKVVYSMMSDAELHVAAIWGRCKGWSSGKKNNMVPEYGHSVHQKKAGHACRVIVGHTFTADDRSKYTGRQVLALLCFLALKDLSMF